MLTRKGTSGIAMIFFQAGVATYFIAFLSSMIGLGGGFLFIPLFTWMGFDYTTETLPTSLLLNLVTALIAQRAYIKKKLTVVKTAVVLGASAAMVAPFGAYATRFIDDNTLKMVFAVIVATIALQLIFFRANKDAGSLEDKRELSNVIAIPAGMFAGVMSGMLGVGGWFYHNAATFVSQVSCKKRRGYIFACCIFLFRVRFFWAFEYTAGGYEASAHMYCQCYGRREEWFLFDGGEVSGRDRQKNIRDSDDIYRSEVFL